jgi:4-amino-4-deoxy-L-arabinose transferase-like glycosyltransferase
MTPHLAFKGNTWHRDLLLITILCLLLYGLYLGAYPLILPDEGRYSDIAREMLRHGNYLTPYYNGIPFFDKPPLFFWMETLFIRLAGLNEWGLRLWPITVATMGCMGSYVAGRKLFNRATGCWAATIQASCLFYFMMAHVADLDLTVATFIALSLFSFLIAAETRQHKSYYYYAAYVFSALAILSKGLIGIVLPAMVIGLWILLLNRWRLLRQMRLLTGLAIILVITSPWFLLMHEKHPGFLHYFFYTQQFHRYLSQHFNSRHGVWFYPFIITVGTLPWTPFVFRAIFSGIKLTWKNHQQETIPLFLLLWIISITLFFSIPTSKTLSYILPIFPAIALVTAAYLEQKLRLGKFQKSVRLPIVISLLMYPMIMFSLSHYGDTLRLPSSKVIAQQLKPLLKPTDTVVFYETFYPDISLYLDHNVLIAGDFADERLWDNWRLDFYQGLKDPKYQSQQLTPKQLKERWLSHKKVYILTSDKMMSKFRQINLPDRHLMAHHQHLWLFRND